VITALIVTYVVLGMTTVKILDNNIGLDWVAMQFSFHPELRELPTNTLRVLVVFVTILMWPVVLKELYDGYW